MFTRHQIFIFFPISKLFDLRGRFSSVNQGLNDEGRCCEVHAQTLLNTYISCYPLAVNEICQRYHFQKQKIAKNFKFIKNGRIIYQSIRNFM